MSMFSKINGLIKLIMLSGSTLALANSPAASSNTNNMPSVEPTCESQFELIHEAPGTIVTS
jgi:hypothetical protein